MNHIKNKNNMRSKTSVLGVQISSRVNKLEESGIRKVFELAAKGGDNLINLAIGQPHFSTPTGLKKAAQIAIDNNFNNYMPTQGYLPLREKIVEKLNNKNHIKASAKNIIITAGVSGGIFLLFSSVLNEGDEVILPDPYFVLYKEVLEFLGVKIVLLDTYPKFRIDSKKLEKLVTKKTKLIIVNTPNNPTGVVYSKSELEGVAKVAKKYDLLIMSDEIYEEFDYDKKFFSVGSIYDKTITLNGFSKSHSVTGWRVGYAHGPAEIIEAMNKLQMYTFICAPSFAQVALVNNFEPVELKQEFKNYKKKRDFVYNSLKNKYELNISEGAFYAFICHSRGGGDPENFTKELLDKKLLVVLGNVFSKRNDYFRLSFAVSDEVLKKGVDILLRL